MNKFEYAKEAYMDLGVDIQKALESLKQVPLSIHCWQGDDVGGFEQAGAMLEGGGIQVTGNYPGKARNLSELRQDLEKLYSIIPGKHRLNLHSIYGDFNGQKIERNNMEPRHFQSWIDWARENQIKIDFNGTFFSHPRAESGFTLSHRDKAIRNFWIEHAKACRNISRDIGKQLGSPCINNLWIPDGSKDLPVDRMGSRTRLKESLDEIYEENFNPDHTRDALESKLFGIGSESYVVGSHEFYMGYCLSRDKMICLDTGHFHPTESIADKISSVFQFQDELLLHVSRPMRWDSDHVVILNDDILYLMQELVRCGKLSQTHIGLDFFDATINRLGAWAIGSRSALKGLLFALLEPHGALKNYEEQENLFARLALLEQLKTMPFGIVWDSYCEEMSVPTDSQLINQVMEYEKNVLSKRNN